MSITDLSVEQLQQIIEIKFKIQKLEVRLAKLSSGAASTPTANSAASKARPLGKRKMSAAARARIGAAAKARWARIRAGGDTAAKPKAAAAPKSKNKKGGITPEGRARLAAAMKARWAARKKGASAPNTKL